MPLGAGQFIDGRQIQYWPLLLPLLDGDVDIGSGLGPMHQELVEVLHRTRLATLHDAHCPVQQHCRRVDVQLVQCHCSIQIGGDAVWVVGFERLGQLGLVAGGVRGQSFELRPVLVRQTRDNLAGLIRSPCSGRRATARSCRGRGRDAAMQDCLAQRRVRSDGLIVEADRPEVVLLDQPHVSLHQRLLSKARSNVQPAISQINSNPRRIVWLPFESRSVYPADRRRARRIVSGP